jgi:hypothetical protein
VRFGLAKDAALAFSAAAANLGINAESAGTNLSKMYGVLLKGFTRGSKTIAKIMGKTSAQIQKAYAEDPEKAVQALLKSLGKLSKADQLVAIEKIFGNRSELNRLVGDLANSLDRNLNPALETSATAWKDATAAAAEFEKRNATVKSAFARLKNGVLDAAVSIGEGMTPALGRAADKLAAFLSQDKNRKKLEDFGRKIGDFIDKIDFDKVTRGAEGFINALKPAVGVIGQIASAIAKLPPEVIGVGGATILADRLSGGAISSAAGGAIGGLGESLAKTLAARIPVFGKAFVQPVFVTNMGPLGGVGGAGGIGSAVAAGGGVAAAGAAVGAAGLAVGVGVVMNEISGAAVNALVSSMPGATGTPVAKALQDAATRLTPLQSVATIMTNLDKIPGQLAQIPGDLEKVRTAIFGGATKTAAEVRTAKNAITSNERGEGAKHRASLASIREKQQASITAYRAGERATTSAVQRTGGKLDTANARLAAIRAKRTSFTTNVRVNAYTSVRTVNGSLTTSARYASGTNTQGR